MSFTLDMGGSTHCHCHLHRSLKKKKQPGFINQIRMHELKCLVILWGGFFVSYFFLVFSLFPPSYFFTFLRFRVIVECAETEQAKLRLCWQGDITIPNYNSQLKF